MSVLYVLKVTAITPRGEFTGTIGEPVVDREVQQRAIDGLRETLSRLRYLALDTEDGYEIVLNEKMIERSVFKFKVATKIVNLDK